jgi:BD-FAE
MVSTKATHSNDPLRFPVDGYTEKTITVITSSGEVEVTYRLYKHIIYVANPVDAEFQSLNVKIPIKTDGKDVDATNAPILFDINVPGYLAYVAGIGPKSRPTGGPQGPAGMSRPPGDGPSPVVDPGLVLAAGYVLVESGCRGRDNQATDGTYYGKAPAAIVDLKSAVRYIRHNKVAFPGNPDWIISMGGSAGGALSALLGASGNSHLYDPYFEGLGSAEEQDNIHASADFCPITDLEHADMAYEWEFGNTPINGALVNQDLSRPLKNAFGEYLASLHLEGKFGFGPLSTDNYGEYLLRTYLIPSANKYMRALTDKERSKYLVDHPWISRSDDSARFTFEDYVAHVGRLKRPPAFDDFDMSQAETILFGNEKTNARHFTNFSLQQTSGDQNAGIDDDLKTVVNLMNPMYFITQGCSGCAKHWWIRHGCSDNHTALPIIVNLATCLENKGKDVNARLYWDAGHKANEDPDDFFAWVRKITVYTR